LKIDHIAIWVRDLEKIRIFYETYFGAKSNDIYFNRRHEFSSNFLTFDDGTRLELMQMPSIPESSNNPYKQFIGFIHLAISVGSKEEVITLTNRLANDGYEVLDGPRYTGDGYFESTILDPEKNRIEITVWSHIFFINREIIVISGTGRGTDTICLIKPAPIREFKNHELKLY